MPTVYFQTFGCQMNVADSNEFESLLSVRGFTEAVDAATADLIVVNTCSVRENAELRAKARIFEFSRLKKRGAQLWVIGCMAERLGDSLRKEIRGVDRVIGAKSIEQSASVIDEVYSKNSVHSGAAVTAHDAGDFISIMRGCDNYCTYCIVPYVRGHESSIDHTLLIDTIRKKTAAGVREITLLGQNVNSYSNNGVDFPDLLSKVAEVEGIKRIRFTTSHPKDCSEKLVRTVAALPKCCHHIHLPVQAGADRVLEIMNRRYSAAEYRERVSMIRSSMPDADITTDILVGFPSETDAEFEETLRLVREVRYTTAFMFAYSPRKGTVAATMEDSVSHEVKQARLRTLIELQTSITREIYSGMIGKTVELMVSGRQEKREKQLMATDNGCKRALIACDDVAAGTILTARVVAASGMTLLCEKERV